MGSPNLAVFLDRDGVITSNVYYEEWGEWEAPMKPEDVLFLPGTIEALSLLQRSGYLMFIVSNQGAYAKGKAPLESLIQTGLHVEKMLNTAGIQMTQAYYAYGHPDGIVKGFSGESLERKPHPYFLYLASATYHIDLSRSWMVGDRITDIQCGLAAGCQTIWVSERNLKAPTDMVTPTIQASNLLEATAYIVNYNRLSEDGD